MLLKEGDEITFVLRDSQLKYTVKPSFLYIKTADSKNYAIFQHLQLDKIKFTSETYGYPSTKNGSWPECHVNDYEALSRCVEKLAEYCQDVLVNGKSIKSSVFVHKPKITLKFN